MDGQNGADGFDFQNKLARDDDTALNLSPTSAPL
jgi:hypothetical protein